MCKSKIIDSVVAIWLLFFLPQSVVKAQSIYVLSGHLDLGVNTIVGRTLESEFSWGRSFSGGIKYTSFKRGLAIFTDISFINDRVSNSFNQLFIRRRFINLGIGLRKTIIPNMLHGVVSPFGRYLVYNKVSSVDARISSNLETFSKKMTYGFSAKILLDVSTIAAPLFGRRGSFLSISYDHGFTPVYETFTRLISAKNSKNFHRSIRSGVMVTL